MYKYVFLDLDDTIWDFRANAKESLREVYYKLGLDRHFPDYEHFFKVYITRNNELWDMYGKGEISREYLMKERFSYPLRYIGIDDEDMPHQVSEMYLDMLPTRTRLVEHGRELLDYLYPKYPLTIISNGFARVQYKKMENSKIDHYFAHVVLSDDVKSLKPDKHIFEHALKLNNAKPEEAIMIGDIYGADILGAQNAGIDQILYNWRDYQFQENETATYVVDSLKEIFDIL